MKYVIAGDYLEFEHWLIKNNHNLLDYTYVYDASVFTGIENPHGIFTGSYRSRKDLVEIVSKLLTRIIPAPKKDSALWKLYYELLEEIHSPVNINNPTGHVKGSITSPIIINIGHPGSGGTGVIGGTGHSAYRTIYDKIYGRKV